LYDPLRPRVELLDEQRTSLPQWKVCEPTFPAELALDLILKTFHQGHCPPKKLLAPFQTWKLTLRLKPCQLEARIFPVNLFDFDGPTNIESRITV
jgi:hypothetical protein